MTETKLVKVRIGDQPVVSATSLGGYPPSALVEVPDWEAERIVRSELGSYTSSKKEPDVVEPDRLTNAPKTNPADANK